MKTILLIESSPRGNDSYSHQAARSIVNELVRVEGVANSAIGPEKALASARTQSTHVLAQLA